MKNIALLLILALTSINLQAQNDPAAVKLLNKVSNKLSTYKNIYAEFKYALVNKKAGVSQETKGNVTIQGDKFHANYMGIDDIYDGVKRYQVVHENEEVNISKHRDDDEFTPNKIFTFYKKGYQQKMDIKQKVQGRTIQFIKLFPKNSNSSESYILLGIDSKTNHIYKAIIVEKNGSKITLDITKFQTNQVLGDHLFKFVSSKYPDYYINELD